MNPRELLKEHGLAASKERGQNFLTQPATARAIAQSAGLADGDTAVEIGPGLGALTLPLAGLCSRVVAVELDRGVHQVLSGVLARAGADNVELIHGDALKLDWEAVALEAGGPVVVVGNLPYSVSSPLIFRLLDSPAAWRSATLMLQQEVVTRMGAKPGGRDYGRLSVMVQAACAVRPGAKVGPDQFFPRPKVASQVVHLEPLAQPLVPLEQAPWFGRVVAAAFGQRRKTVANSLAAGLGISRGQAAQALEAAGLEPGLRAEKLSPQDLASLALSLEPLAGAKS